MIIYIVVKVIMLIFKNKICNVVRILKTRIIILDYMKIKLEFGWEGRVW